MTPPKVHEQEPLKHLRPFRVGIGWASTTQHGEFAVYDCNDAQFKNNMPRDAAQWLCDRLNAPASHEIKAPRYAVLALTNLAINLKDISKAERQFLRDCAAYIDKAALQSRATLPGTQDARAAEHWAKALEIIRAYAQANPKWRQPDSKSEGYWEQDPMGAHAWLKEEAARTKHHTSSGPAALIEAADKLVNQFAWSAVRADCEESRGYLNELIGNVRTELFLLTPEGSAAKEKTE